MPALLRIQLHVLVHLRLYLLHVRLPQPTACIQPQQTAPKHTQLGSMEQNASKVRRRKMRQ
eukprot:COSAG02_NODE_987_length_15443_cov_8.132625_4_plen_61_part_00